MGVTAGSCVGCPVDASPGVGAGVGAAVAVDRLVGVIRGAGVGLGSATVEVEAGICVGDG